MKQKASVLLLQHGSKDIFVHSSGLNTRAIQENDKVVFDVQKSDKGLNAVNVKLA